MLENSGDTNAVINILEDFINLVEKKNVPDEQEEELVGKAEEIIALLESL